MLPVSFIELIFYIGSGFCEMLASGIHSSVINKASEALSMGDTIACTRILQAHYAKKDIPLAYSTHTFWSFLDKIRHRRNNGESGRFLKEFLSFIDKGNIL